MDELHGGRELVGGVAALAANSAGGGEGEDGAEALAAGRDQVGREVGNSRDGAGRALCKQALDLGKLWPQEVHQPIHRGRLRRLLLFNFGVQGQLQSLALPNRLP